MWLCAFAKLRKYEDVIWAIDWTAFMCDAVSGIYWTKKHKKMIRLLNIWGVWTFKASCATKAWRHNMPPPPASWQYLPSYLFARWHLFRHVGYLRHQQQVDVWPFDLKVVSESRVTWATSVPISVFLGLSVLELGPMYATDRQTDRRQIKASLMPPPYGGGGITTHKYGHVCMRSKNIKTDVSRWAMSAWRQLCHLYI